MKIIKKNILMLPLQYMFYSRSRSWINKISFLTIVLIPIIIHVCLMCGWEFDVLNLCMGLVAEFSVYEIGYIYNDVYAFAKEKKGRQWLENERLEDVKNKFPLYIAARVLYIGLAVFILDMRKCKNVPYFILCLVILYVVYAAHNYWRAPINTLTFMLLNIFKYSAVFILFTDDLFEVIVYSSYIFLEIGLLRTVTYGMSRKYILSRQESWDTEKNRVKYSLAVLSVSGIAAVCDSVFCPFLIGSLYMFIYRLVCYLFSHNDRFKNRMICG